MSFVQEIISPLVGSVSDDAQPVTGLKNHDGKKKHKIEHNSSFRNQNVLHSNINVQFTKPSNAYGPFSAKVFKNEIFVSPTLQHDFPFPGAREKPFKCL